MALKITSNPTFRHTVTVMVPVDGGFDKQTVDVTYNVVPAAEAATFTYGTAEGTTSFLLRAVAKVDGVVDDAGQPVPYSDKLREQLLALPFVRRALVDAYS